MTHKEDLLAARGIIIALAFVVVIWGLLYLLVAMILGLPPN